ncbi:MAG: hypothetical protein CMF69_08940 [Magnetovibrio sp.]|nr:hypothetical protein [Magnetovibrio sp.]
MSSKIIDCVLVNSPVSSPLHPQLNLPLLKSAIENNGFGTRVIDANIEFFRWFLGTNYEPVNAQRFKENPLHILSSYNDLDKKLWQASQRYEGLHVGVRSLSMKHDRLSFDSILDAVEDNISNPFIEFFEKILTKAIQPTKAPILAIGITFQDQIIPSYTLAALARKKLPDIKIVLGGQMITRCYDSIICHEGIASLSDYLVLWDGEVPLVNLLGGLLRQEANDQTNIIDLSSSKRSINRKGAVLKGKEIPRPDFSDLPLDSYFLPEPLIPLQTTRGCYAECAFCAIPFGSNMYRVRNAESIIEDIKEVKKYAKEHFGLDLKYFKFMEDTSSPSLLYALAREIEEQNIDIRWETFARLEKAFVEPGFMAQLFRGGCRKIHWGLETNDPDILEKMSKGTEITYTSEVLRLSAQAGIMNFCFVLIGFPGETNQQREALTQYIINNDHIHTITLATFDLTRGAPMERSYKPENCYALTCEPAQQFQVRLPYLVGGEDWKAKIIPIAHRMMIEIIRARPDIGFVTLFPDQVRAMLTDWHGNNWGRIFVEQYGAENIRQLLINTEEYADNFESQREIDYTSLPEPLTREHFRTKEDLDLLRKSVMLRREYENRRLNQL